MCHFNVIGIYSRDIKTYCRFTEITIVRCRFSLPLCVPHGPTLQLKHCTHTSPGFDETKSAPQTWHLALSFLPGSYCLLFLLELGTVWCNSLFSLLAVSVIIAAVLLFLPFMVAFLSPAFGEG